MAAATATMPESVQVIDEALAALAKIDLRKVKDTDTRVEIKDARGLLQGARKRLSEKK